MSRIRRGVAGVSPSLTRGALVALLTTAFVPAARAQSRTAQVAHAEQLFEDAKRLLDKKDVARACAAFAESQKLDPQLGTLLNLALCHERDGKHASAWSEYTSVVSLATRAGQAKRAEFAKERARSLEPRLSRVRFDASRLPSDAQVTIDGAAVDRKTLDDTAVPLDPGTHSVLVTAEGMRPGETTVDVPPGPSMSSFRFEPLSPAPAAPTSPAAPAPAPPPRKEASAAAPAGLRSIQWAGVATAGLGVAGVAIGGVFGLRAAALKEESGCAVTCTTEGARTLADARDAGAIATGAFIAGGVLVAAGAVLVVLGRPSRRGSTSALDHAGAVVF